MPWTEQQIADHIEMDHERELAPGTKDVRGIHAEMHRRAHTDWGHTHFRGEIRFEESGWGPAITQLEVDIHV